MLEDLKLTPEYDGFLFLAESARNPPVLKPHYHVELELNLVARGCVTYVVHGKRFRFETRSLLWLFPAQEHQLVDRSEDAQYYVAVFKPSMIRQACRGQRYQALKAKQPEQDTVLHSLLTPPAFELLRRTMEEIVKDGLDPDILNREAGFGLSPAFSFSHPDPDWLNAALRHLLLMAWRCQQQQTERHSEVELHPGVLRALQILETDEAPETFAALASQCGVSYPHFCRLFHRQVGVTLSRYRNSLRLSRFFTACQSPRINMLEAVYAAGFGSYSQFYRVFVEAYGAGPRETLRAEP